MYDWLIEDIQHTNCFETPGVECNQDIQEGEELEVVAHTRRVG